MREQDSFTLTFFWYLEISKALSELKISELKVFRATETMAAVDQARRCAVPTKLELLLTMEEKRKLLSTTYHWNHLE